MSSWRYVGLVSGGYLGQCTHRGNAFLATKTIFINEIADLCEKVGADVCDMARGIGQDGRIGRNFLHSGPGFGGSCFPQGYACLGLHRARRQRAANHRQADHRGEQQPQEAAGTQVIDYCGGVVSGLMIGVLGATFKPNTDDMRDAPSLDIVPVPQAAGAKIVAFGLEGMTEDG
jgi:UDPglucose 6-dehydrogenase